MLAIKNMEMPEGCLSCKLCYNVGVYSYCALDQKNKLSLKMYDKRKDDCPLVEIEEPKTGHWVDDEVDSFSKSFGYKKFHCSRCLKVIEGSYAKKTDYCPNCGAKMISEVEE